MIESNVVHAHPFHHNVCVYVYRFYAPNAGQLLLDGTDIKDLDPDLLTREIALVGQVSLCC